MKRSRRPDLRLQRLARSGFARLLAHAMALLLVLANFSAWATPVSHAAALPAAHAMAQSSAHRHCDEAASAPAASAKKAMHGTGGSCCAGDACACLHPCPGVPAAVSLALVSVPAMQSLPLPDVALGDATGERRLRPPIA